MVVGWTKRLAALARSVALASWSALTSSIISLVSGVEVVNSPTDKMILAD